MQASTFHSQAFRESFRRVFAPPDDEGYLGLSSNAQLQACNICFLSDAGCQAGTPGVSKLLWAGMLQCTTAAPACCAE